MVNIWAQWKNALTNLTRRYVAWRQQRKTSHPPPLNLPIEPGDDILVYVEYGDPTQPAARYEWPPAGPTSAYPQANDKKTGEDSSE